MGRITEFLLFPKLPKEIRCMIWIAALPDPRVFSLEERCAYFRSCTYCHYGVRDVWREGEHNSESFCVGHWKLEADVDIPVLLHVNSEARNMASKSYCRTFTYNYDYEGDGGYGRPTVYFDYSRDTLLIDQRKSFEPVSSNLRINFHSSQQVFKKDEISKVQNLALWADWWTFHKHPAHSVPEFHSTEEWLAEVLGFFGGVKTLTLIFPDQQARLYIEANQKSELVLHEKGYDIGRAIQVYSRVNRDDIQPDYITDVASVYKILHLDLDLLERYRRGWVTEGKGNWEMPRVELKHLMTAEFDTRLKVMEKKYHRKLRENRLRMGIPEKGGLA